MKLYQRKLEGGYRLIRIKNQKRAIFIFVLVTMIAGWAYIWFSNGASMKPFYAPLDTLAPWLILMLLITMGAGMAFRDLEIKSAKRDSQRYLMAKNSQRRAIWTIIIAITVFIILVMPQTSEFVSYELSSNRSEQVFTSQIVQIGEFSNQDVFGLTKVEWFSFTASSGNLTVRVYKEGRLLDEKYLLTGGQWRITGYNDGDFYKTFNASVFNPGSTPATFTLEVHVKLDSTMVTVVPAFMIFFIALSAAWYIRLMPVRQKYASASIYSIDYVQEVDTGEQTYTKYDIRGRPQAATAGTELPPPPETTEEAPPPPPPIEGIPAVQPSEPATAVAKPEEVKITEEPIQTFDMFIEEGSKLFTNGDYQGALKNFESALNIEPGNNTALLAKGRTLVKLERQKEALLAFEKVIASESENDKALHGKAIALVALRQWSDAVKALDAYLRIKPADEEALGMKGDALMSLGKRNDAILAYETALNLKPDDEDLRAKLEKAKVDVAALLSAAMMATATANYEQALSQYGDVLKVEPQNIRALLGRAGVLRRLGNKDEAIGALNEVLQIEPENPGALLEKTRLQLDAKDIVKALETAELLVKVSPNDARGWILRGDLLVEQMRFDEAKQSYEKCSELEPSNPEVGGKLESLETRLAESGEGLLARILDGVKGIGPAKVKSLYEAGFRTADDLRTASLEQLANVKGISFKLADDILTYLRGQHGIESP